MTYTHDIIKTAERLKHTILLMYVLILSEERAFQQRSYTGNWAICPRLWAGEFSQRVEIDTVNV